MSDEGWLLIVLVAIYLADCLRWVPEGGGVFVKSWGGWRWRTGSRSLGTAKGGFVFGWPLPPLLAGYRCERTRARMGLGGVVADVGGSLLRAEGRRALEFSEVAGVRSVEKVVEINGEKFWVCGSGEEAKKLAASCREMRELGEEERDRRMRAELARRFDRRGIRRAHRRVQVGTRRLRWWCDGFFVAAFVAGPGLVVGFGSDRALLPVLIGGVVAGVAIAVYAARVHRRLWPEALAERRKSFWKMALCPISAARAVDEIAVGALEEFDAAAVAMVLCSREEARELVEGARRKLAAGVGEWHAERMRELFDGLGNGVGESERVRRGGGSAVVLPGVPESVCR